MDKNKINDHSKDLSLDTNILKFLTQKQKDHINDIKFAVDFHKGEVIFKQGAPMSHIIILVEGFAKIYLEDTNDKNILLRIIKPGEIIGGPGFFTDYKHHFSVSAMMESKAFFIDIEAFRQMVLNNAEFGLNLIGYLNRAHINIYDRIKINTHKQMNGRIANTLLYLSDKVYEDDEFVTTLSRQDLADMSHMTKESAIRILKDFKSSGYIDCNNNSFHLLDKNALKHILESG